MAAESILIIGIQDPKLSSFLGKMGYTVTAADDTVPLPEVLSRKWYDLILINCDESGDVIERVDFLRADDRTRDVPLLVLSDHTSLEIELSERAYDRILIKERDSRAGSLVSSIATELRLRKFDGADEQKASLADANAALRNLNARFTKQLEEAKSMQRALLPDELPEDPRVDLAVHYQPLEEVGGDWYYIDAHGDILRILIADVTGHGLSAAFIGSMTKLALNASGDAEPAELLSKINSLISPVLPAGSFITAFCLRYNLATGKLQFARAGHPPALLYLQSTGQVEEVKGEGFALGFFDEGEYQAGERQMEPGDFLVTYTDALPESLNRDGEMYNYDRMSSVISSASAETSASVLLEDILKDFDNFRNERIVKDDTTLITLKRIS